MALREVRVKEWRNQLVFRFDPVEDTIELVERGRKILIRLDDYRPAHLRRQRDEVGINFDIIEGTADR